MTDSGSLFKYKFFVDVFARETHFDLISRVCHISLGSVQKACGARFYSGNGVYSHLVIKRFRMICSTAEY